ncbi:MAG: serine hydrolase domain-containing protein [Sneathiella sp.]
MTLPNFNAIDDLLSSYVNSGRLAGAVAAVSNREGKIYSKVIGLQDITINTPMTLDSLFRIYSMTKPITSIATMMLWEKGKFKLDDPVRKFLPSFKKTRILAEDGTLRAAAREVTIRHLLCHTAGITLPAFADNHLVPLYRENQLDGVRSQGNLSDIVDRLGALPVLFEPGSQWSYSMATDVLGRLVEIWSEQPFADFLEASLFKPLGMKDTTFHVAQQDITRLTTNYSIKEEKLSDPIDIGSSSTYLSPPEFCSGAGGLISSANDYLHLIQMLNNDGVFERNRIVKKETLALMTKNHLGSDMTDFGAKDFNGSNWDGIGFGLGFSVVISSNEGEVNCPAGEYGWTGAAGTMFFINPKLNISALLLTQYMPSRTYPLRSQFRRAVYNSISNLNS